MSYRVCRKFTSSTFEVEGQLCKVFLEPMHEYRPGFYAWNVGFAVGKSTRQLNDWYWRRKNRRVRSLRHQMTGRNGIKAIRRGFEEVLRLRWCIEPGDVMVIDCTSGDPDRQFRAFSRWYRHHPEWIIDYERREFYWHRPPYADDPARKMFDIRGIIPSDPLANTAGENYFAAFRVERPAGDNALSNEQITDLLNLVLTSG